MVAPIAAALVAVAGIALAVGDTLSGGGSSSGILALVFLVFDVEIVFLYPWTVQVRELGWFGFTAAMIFIGVLVLGLAYDWKKGALEWE